MNDDDVNRTMKRLVLTMLVVAGAFAMVAVNGIFV